MVKAILVPVDFSPNSRVAYYYAIELALQFKASLHLYHSTTPYIQDPDLNLKEKEQDYSRMRERMKRKIRGWIHKATERGVNCHFHSSLGNARNEIPKQINSGKYDLVVMGTKGASRMKGLLIGSNTSHVILRSEIPVLAIPEKFKFKNFKKILAAINYQMGDLDSIAYLIKWKNFFKSELTFFHIADKEFTYGFSDFLMENFTEEVKARFPDLKADYKLLPQANPSKEIQKVISSEKPDLLVMFTRKRNFLSRMLKGSITAKVAFVSTIPLLAVPSDN